MPLINPIKLISPTHHFQAINSSLEYLYANEWGLAPVVDKNRSKYYVLFIDYFIKYY